MLASHDAALLHRRPRCKSIAPVITPWDLAEEWIGFTGKPFVFAFWAVRREALKSSRLDLAAIAQRVRDTRLGTGGSGRGQGERGRQRLRITAKTLFTNIWTTNINYYPRMEPPAWRVFSSFTGMFSNAVRCPACSQLCFAKPKPRGSEYLDGVPVPLRAAIQLLRSNAPAFLKCCLLSLVWRWVIRMGGAGLVLIGVADDSIVSDRRRGYFSPSGWPPGTAISGLITQLWPQWAQWSAATLLMRLVARAAKKP